MHLIYIIPISIFTILMSSLLFQKAAGSLNPLKPNMISYIFYYNLILQTFIGAILIASYADRDHYVISTVTQAARLNGWLSVCYMMLAMPFGMLLAKVAFSKHTNIKTRLMYYSNAPVNLSYIGYKPLKYSVWIFTLLSSLSCLYVFYIIGYFPFFKIFDVSYLTAAELRISVSRDFAGNDYIKNLGALLMMPILSYIWLFYYLKTKNALDLLVFILCFIFSLSILFYSFAKSPMLMYLLSFIFVYFYSKGKLNKKITITIFITVIILLYFLYNFMGLTNDQFLNYNEGPMGRLILGQASGLYLMLDIFPREHDFIGLSSISQLLSNFLGIEYIDRAARITMISFNPHGVDAGTSGVMNSIYIAEAWANFGIFGIILSPIWVGFIIQSLYIYFLKAPKSPVHLAFFVSFSINGAVTGGINDYIYNPYIIFVIGFAALLIFTSQFLKRAFA